MPIKTIKQFSGSYFLFGGLSGIEKVHTDFF